MEYQPLDVTRNQIRLITLLPQPQSESSRATERGQPGSVIHCTLENVSLDDYSSRYRQFITTKKVKEAEWKFQRNWKLTCIEEAGIQIGDITLDWSTSLFWRFIWGDFVALSYTWGDRVASRPVIVNGVVVEVTENLEAALRRLSTMSDYVEGLKLWVDALCINQNDLAERNLQVTRMRDLYEQAMAVITWLGPEADESNKAMDLLEVYGKKNSLPEDEIGPFLHAVRTEHDFFPPGSWKALYHFLDRDYWKRLWIIQEVAMSHIGLEVICGKQSLYGIDLIRAINLMTVEIDVIEEKVAEDFEQAGHEYNWAMLTRLARMQYLLMFRHVEIAGDDYPELAQLLKANRSSKQKDARDKIYGVLGMMDPSIVAHIQPDYNSSVLEVYTAFTKAIILTTKKLDIIYQSRTNTSDQQEYPS
ncbi:hypothetical protein MMC16_007766 [Acarospora aff. strigata]|nr:hypothetical protein [Acarospora aff. strigata]